MEPVITLPLTGRSDHGAATPNACADRVGAHDHADSATATGVGHDAAPARGAARSLRPRRVVPPLWREYRAAGILLSMLRDERGGAQPRPIRGTPVLLVPGVFAGDASLAPLAGILRDHGWAVWPSGIRNNVGCSGAIVQGLLTGLEEIAAAHATRVAIVGHSRGGLLARAAAQRRPDLVSGVVTLGSPHRDQLAVHPLLWANVVALATLGSLGVSGLMRFGCRGRQDCCRGFDHDVAAPLPADIGAISLFSRRDGVVDWRACIDPDARNVEVTATHCGMPSDPATVQVILRALADFQSSPHVEPVASPIAA
jgi:triacylglycerol lipase